MIYVTDQIQLDPSELEISFIRASGPGGQNVNKVSSAVQLRFDALHSKCLPPSVRHRLLALAGTRANQHGVIVIEAKRYRHQTRNREDAIERLVALISSATHVDPPRRKSKPSRASVKRHQATKKQRGTLKKLRRGPGQDD